MVGAPAAELSTLSALENDEVTSRLRELELQLRRGEADMALLVGEAERRGLCTADGHRSVRNYLRAELNWSPMQIVRRRRLSALFDLVPDAWVALSEGRIGIAQADELGRARANPRCGDLLGESANLLLDYCEQMHFDDARACVQRWEIHADLDGAHRERLSSQERRRAFVGEHDGGVVIEATGGASIDAAELMSIFDAFVEAEFRNDVAQRTERFGPDTAGVPLRRTDAQRRFDALHSIFRAAAANPTLAHAIPMLVNVVVDDATFRNELARHGLSTTVDALGQRDPAEARCESDNSVQLLPEDALRAALSGHIRRVVIDGAGVVTNVGRKRRLFTGTMREVAKLLAQRCTGPGCTVRSRFAQVDHLAEWAADHSETSLANSGPDCGRHNRHKHRHRLRTSRRPDGLFNWYRADGSEMAPVGRPHVADSDEIDTAIRHRIDHLIASRSDS